MGENRFFVIGSFLSCCCWGGGGHFRTRKVICGQEETTCHSVLYICTSEEKRSIDKNKYIGYGIVTIEKRTFELWKQRFENFVGRVDALCVPLRRKRDKWLDNCETCRLLNVSARTMQTYRDTGKLPYSQINNKIYYKASDVETFLLNQVRDNSKK